MHMVSNIEFRNETDEDYNVLVCKSSNTNRLYIHLVGDMEEFHGDEATTVEAKDYEIAEVNDTDT